MVEMPESLLNQLSPSEWGLVFVASLWALATLFSRWRKASADVRDIQRHVDKHATYDIVVHDGKPHVLGRVYTPDSTASSRRAVATRAPMKFRDVRGLRKAKRKAEQSVRAGLASLILLDIMRKGS